MYSRIYSGWPGGPSARVCGIVAADHCFRAFLHLHGDLGWGRDALFDMRISPWQKNVTFSCPGHHRTRVFTGDPERGARVCAALWPLIIAVEPFYTSMGVLGGVEKLLLT